MNRSRRCRSSRLRSRKGGRWIGLDNDETFFIIAGLSPMPRFLMLSLPPFVSRVSSFSSSPVSSPWHPRRPQLMSRPFRPAKSRVSTSTGSSSATTCPARSNRASTTRPGRTSACPTPTTTRTPSTRRPIPPKATAVGTGRPGIASISRSTPATAPETSTSSLRRHGPSRRCG